MAMTTYWIFGRAGAGKSTLASFLNQKLVEEGKAVEQLDGDQIRQQTGNEDYTFHGRKLHLSYMAHMARILNSHRIYVVASFITPFESYRRMIKETIPDSCLIYLNVGQKEGLKRKANLVLPPSQNTGGTWNAFEDPQYYDLEVLAGMDQETIQTIVWKHVQCTI